MMISNLEYSELCGQDRPRPHHQRRPPQRSGDSLAHSEKEGRGGVRSVRYSPSGVWKWCRSAVWQPGISPPLAALKSEIGETVNGGRPLPLPAIKVDQPTLTMVFRVNDGPLAGQYAQYLTSRQLRDRLFREAKVNVALEVSETESPDQFRVSGRGELHLSVLIETMRREGYSFCVTKPEPVLKHTEAGVLEPNEYVHIDVPQDHFGSVMELIGQRKGELQSLNQGGEGRMRAEFLVPARG